MTALQDRMRDNLWWRAQGSRHDKKGQLLQARMQHEAAELRLILTLTLTLTLIGGRRTATA
jgi:hypothetical protein